MELNRKPFQGIFNIIRFNRHFYLIIAIALASIIFFDEYVSNAVHNLIWTAAFLMILTTIISLLVSFYIYDASGFYRLDWILALDNKNVLNISAGFDETSEIIRRKFKKMRLTICDFYNPEKHTEISIKRARKAYPVDLKCIQVSSEKLPFADNFFDTSLAILSAHEIRNEKERIIFSKKLTELQAGKLLLRNTFEI